MNTCKNEVQREFTQFDLTKITLNNLNNFDITPTAKLVLLYLTSCYNPNHADVFPKQKTIADRLGVSERSVTRAIQELFKAGLILIECKYTNRYIFSSNLTSQLSQGVNSKGVFITPSNTPILSDVKCKNVTLQSDKLADTCIRTNKHEQINNKRVELIEGGNVYSEDEEILKDYAIKHNARNIKAYINTLKSSGSANKILKEYKTKNLIVKRAEQSLFDTQLTIQKYKSFKNNCVMPQTCAAWVELGKKFGIN